MKPKTPTDLFLNEGVKSEITEVILPEDNPSVGKRIVELDFPKTAIIAMIKRDGTFLTPKGSTILEPNDVLIVLSENEHGIDLVHESLSIDNEK